MEKDEVITDSGFLQNSCKVAKSIEEGERIAHRLFNVLKNEKNAVGIAANQIGIDSRVCVVNVTRPIYFINPRIMTVHGSIKYHEGCLSYPDKWVLTERHGSIYVEADNLKEPIYFSSEMNILECVCVQHEIDHLDGITMFDRALAIED